MAEEERLNGALAPHVHDHKAMGEHQRGQWLRLCAQPHTTLPVLLRVHSHPREGVLWHQSSATDLLFITLRKSEALFSPSTCSCDLALGPSLFHRESQSTTTAASATGQRTIHRGARGSRVLLYRCAEAFGYVREQRRQGMVTELFVCLGLARHETHEGERPMARAFRGWRLELEIPAAWLHGCYVAHQLLLGIAAAVAVGGGQHPLLTPVRLRSLKSGSWNSPLCSPQLRKADTWPSTLRRAPQRKGNETHEQPHGREKLLWA